MVLKHTAASVASQVLSGGRFTGMFPDNGESHTVTVKYCPTDDADNQFVRIKDTGDPSLTHRFLPFPFEHETKATITSWYAAMSQAGCDILSSCFYSIGVCISYSGQVYSYVYLIYPRIVTFVLHLAACSIVLSASDADYVLFSANIC